jgi:predicted nucleic-acid-binding Zn-ribbon protein
MAEQRCPKCNSPMEEGFMLDSAYGGPVPGRWIAGEPGRAYLTGFRDRRKLMIIAYRCATCGYLEMYAKDGMESHS